MADRTDDDERTRRRATVAGKRMIRALARVGVDMETIPASNREALALAEQNITVLRRIEQQMNRRVGPTAPTPERIAHANEDPREIEINPAQAKAHQFDWIVEQIRDRLSGRQYEAAERLRDVSLMMEPRSRVADPTAVGGSSDPSKRLALTESQELASRQFHRVMGALVQPFRGIIQNFVLEQAKEGSERCLSVAEWGTRQTKYAGAMARAAGVTAIIMACARLAEAWEEFDDLNRERCTKTDRLMKSDIGRRAAQGGWILALWQWSHAHGRLPTLQGEIDRIRAIHDTDAKTLRTVPPVTLDRWHRRRDRLTAMAFRDEGDDGQKVRVA